MSSVRAETPDSGLNPLDLVEQLAAAQDWAYHRHSEEELVAEVPGQWCGYKLWFGWHPDLEVLQVACVLDLKVPQKKIRAVHGLLALANEKLWLGHFELWSEQRHPAFRHTLLFRDGAHASGELLQEVVDIATGECDRFYPAFQFVLWGGRSPEEALMAALLETEGEA